MAEKRCSLGLFLLLVQASQQVSSASSPSSDYYTGAVVEFKPTYKMADGLRTLRANTDAYVEYVKKASEQGADIVVFPEDGLTSLSIPSRSLMDSWTTQVPSPLLEYVPCTGTGMNVSETLKRLSCAAMRHRIYVVVNIAEKRPCEPGDGCAANGTRYHNTNVAFDRTGKVVARYRKVNMYGEPQFDATKTPEVVTFDTDFGVTFGTFICFDVIFPVPALTLTRTKRVTDIVFSTAWFSELPFLTAVQTHFGWAFAEDVNMLAAGYHNPDIGSAGSGIYLGRDGIANVSMTHDPDYRLLIARVPKKRRNETAKNGTTVTTLDRDLALAPRQNRTGEQPQNRSWIRLLQDYVSFYESVPLNDTQTQQTICSHNFCCDFYVHVSLDSPSASKDVYRAVVYNGTRYYGSAVEAGTRLCGLTRCANESISSCGYMDRSNVTFHALSLTARFNDYPESLVMPSVVDSTLIPFQHWSYIEQPIGKDMNVTLRLNKPTKDLVAFGIYARDFGRDKWHRQHA